MKRVAWLWEGWVHLEIDQEEPSVNSRTLYLSLAEQVEDVMSRGVWFLLMTRMSVRMVFVLKVTMTEAL
jgi:hypothetical protein